MLSPPSSAAKGKKQALPLDLQTIATAIRNLPTDSSALLPSPAPSAQFFEPSLTSGSLDSSGNATASASHPSTSITASGPAKHERASAARPQPGCSASDSIFKKAVDHAIRHTRRRLRHEIARGRITLDQYEASIDKDRRMYEEVAEEDEHQEKWTGGHAPKKRLERVLQKLRDLWIARGTGPLEAVNETGGIVIDKDSIHILTQSLISLQNGDSNQVPPYIRCQPGTVLSWTKYFKGAIGLSDSNMVGSSAQKARTAMPVGPRQLQQPSILASLPVLGRKRRLEDRDLPLVEKRRLISRTTAPGHGESDGAFQFQSLQLSSDASDISNSSIVDSGQACISGGSQGDTSPAGPVIIGFDLISSVASCLDLILHVCNYLRLKDILVLYRVSRVFKNTFDGDLKPNVMRLARQFASSETIAIFPWALYRRVTVELPYPHLAPGESADSEGRRVPSLRYVNMLVSRERKVRDIIACLARAGHRLPRPAASGALKKMWLLMDIPTNLGRVEFLKNETLFTDEDLLAIQMFHVKLVMHFHDPIQGPDHSMADAAAEAGGHGFPGGLGTGWTANMVPDLTDLMVPDLTVPQANDADGGPGIEAWATQAAAAAEAVMRQQQELSQHSLVETLLGQRSGFHVLWSMLRGKAFQTAREVIELKVRYDYIPPTLTYDDTEDEDPASSRTRLTSRFEQASGLMADNQADKARRRALEEAIHAVPVWEMGVGHLEGWGLGSQHLLRPDELIPLEAGRRRRIHPDSYMDMEKHVPFMAVWGTRSFETGENLVPTVEEMYISDSEDEDNVCHNQAAGSGFGDIDAGVAAIIAADVDDVLPISEARMSALCGNVPAKVGEWQPWQVLKTQWDTLPLRYKLDVWWMNLQERLRRQGWTQRDENDNDNRFNQISYDQADDVEEDYGPDDEADIYDDGSGALDNTENNSPSGSTPPCNISPASARPSHSSNHIDGNDLTPALSTRHRNIMDSSIRWALREQDEVDTALLDQAHMDYEVEELEHWEQFLATVSPTIDDDAGDNGDNSDAGAAGNGASFWGEYHDGDSGDDSNWNDSSDDNSSLQTPNAEVVLMPEYGGMNDVLRLVRQLRIAEITMAAAAANSQSQSAAPVNDIMHAERVASVHHLQRKLDAVLRGEVFAIDL